MKFINIPGFILILNLLFSCGQTTDDIRIEADQVREGAFQATALSPTHLVSNYPMSTQQSHPQPIIFKLSLNARDNEASFGQDHQLIVPPGITEFYAPTLKFGVQAPPLPESTLALDQTVNVHFRVDLRPILESFTARGFYVTLTKDTVYADHFQGLYIAGGIEPLQWIWDSPTAPAHLRFQDLDQDSLYELTVRFKPPAQETGERSWELRQDITTLPQFSSPQAPLLEALTNLALEEALLNIREDGSFSAGKEWQGVWTRDVSYAAELSLAYLFPENVKSSLRAKLDPNGRIIQDTGTGGSWPISSDRHIWTLAAWEVFLASGDEAWLEEIRQPVIQSLKEDLLWNRDPVSGMLLGETSFEDWREQTYPEWMTPADIHSSHALSTNIIFKRALEIGLALSQGDQQIISSWPQLIERLDQNILNHFWSDPQNAPASYVITTPAWTPASHRDLLGESLGILFSNSFSSVAPQLVASYPRTQFGSPVISHQLPHSPAYHNKAIWPFVEAYAMLAAKQVGNQEAYGHSFQSLTRAAALFLSHRENYHYNTGRPDQTEINSDRQLWSVAGWLGAVYKGLFGISLSYDFSRSGFDLILSPNNPFQWDHFSLTNLTLHNTAISIKLEGRGSQLTSMEVNGTDHEVGMPIALNGDSLDIVIHLKVAKNDETISPLVFADYVLPDIPSVFWNVDTLNWETESGTAILELNGRTLDTLTEGTLLLSDSLAGFFTLRAFDSTGARSLPSQPYYLGPSAILALNAKEPYYIELGKENTFITMDFLLPSAGNYLIRFIYSNGSGPINTGSTCGLAKLKINNWWLEQMISFPHTASWDKWEFTSWTKAQFEKGQNILILDQESLPVSNMDGTLNQFRIQRVEIVPIPD